MAAGLRTKGLNGSCLLLIVIAGIERFAFKGVASNLVSYLTDFVKMSNSSAAKLVNSWCGLTSMTPLLVAPLADFYWDRYSTIIASSFLYVAGLVALTSTAMEWAWSAPASTRHTSFLYWSLCLISLGQGGYNPSLQAFGAEQLEDDEELPCGKDDKKSTKKTLFFQWWYFGVCGGCLLGVTVMSYIQDTIGWIPGFGIPAVSMIMSIAVFSCGSKIYVYKQHSEPQANRPFRKAAHAVKESASKVFYCGACARPHDESEMPELELQEQPLYVEDFSGRKKITDESPEIKIHMLSNVGVVLRLLPMWVTLLMFAVIFQQPATFFTQQGMTMERTVGSNFKIPPATLQSAITLSIIMLMPLYDTVFIPITRLITRQEKGVSVMQRMGIGMFLSVIAMVIAALVETQRLQISREMKKIVNSQPDETIPLSIFWLLPQYILLGISDIFTVVGMQEFFYSEVPVRMRTVGIALYTSVFGVGSFVSAILITVVEFSTSWFSDDMSEARLDNYYWLLALLCVFSLLLYMTLCRNFKSRCDLEDEN